MTNPWKYVLVDPEAARTNPYLNPRTPPAPEPEPEPEPTIPPMPSASSTFTGNYILMDQASTYALGLHTLQEACKAERNSHQEQIILPDGRTVYRANTFLENILARMNDWETKSDPKGKARTVEDRKRYFDTWLDSSCGVAYKAGDTKFKLQLVCLPLMGIAQDFNQLFMPVDYNSFQGQKFDSSNPNFTRNAWMALLEERTDVYTNYLKMLKEIAGRDITPNFWTRSKDNLKTDELRAVYVSNLGYDSDAYGINVLNYLARFLRRSP